MICRMPTIGACRLTKKIAMMSNAATNARAQCTTSRRKTTSKDEIINSPASTKKIKVARSMVRYCAAMITTAVTTTLSSASGSIIFQPRLIT